MKLPARGVMIKVGLSLLATGLLLFLVLAPGPVEGIYSPFNSYGCMGDQYMVFREGRVVTYVECSKEAAFVESRYQVDPTLGRMVMSYRPVRPGAQEERVCLAEPHWLGTRFTFLHSGKSEWFWKRFSTPARRDLVASTPLKDVFFEKEGVRTVWLDPNFKVTGTSFQEYRKPAAKAPAAGP